MSVEELSRDQLIELKQNYLEEVLGEEPSWYDLANADNIVSDDYVFAQVGATEFVMDDFFCTAGQ